MKKETYEHMINTVSAKPMLAKGIPLFNSIITKAIYVAYPCLLIYLLFWSPSLKFTLEYFLYSDFFDALVVPLVCFVLLTLLRKAINAPRPYEVFETQPLIPKNTKGKSFPSRHVFSIFVIAITFWFKCPFSQIAVCIFVLGVMLAVLRVLSGVHFTKDVVAGALLGIFLAELGFYLL